MQTWMHQMMPDPRTLVEIDKETMRRLVQERRITIATRLGHFQIPEHPVKEREKSIASHTYRSDRGAAYA